MNLNLIFQDIASTKELKQWLEDEKFVYAIFYESKTTFV